MGIEARRKRERLERRNAILRAAIEAYEHEGYYATTMDKIAEIAEFSRATLYLYFKTKDEIFVHAIVSRSDYFADLLEDLYKRRKSVRDHLIDELWWIFKKYYDEEPASFSAILYFHQSEMVRNLSEPLRLLIYRSGARNVSLMHKIAAYGIKEGLFRKCNPKTLAEVIWTSFLGIVQLENSKAILSRKTHMEITRDLAVEVLKKGIRV